jgi:DNA-binding NarL/FixJ family response regulator
MPQGSPIRILLVEDHAMVEEELRLLLRSYPNLEIVDRAQNGEEAISKVAKLHPAVVVMDVNLPKLDGIAATREIKAKYPNIVVIGLTVAAEDYVLYAMLKAGASEVLKKGNVVTDLYRSIQRAVASAHPIVILEEDQAAGNTPASAAEATPLGSIDSEPGAPADANLDSN